MEFFFVMEFAPENLDEMLHRLKQGDVSGQMISQNAAKDIIF